MNIRPIRCYISPEAVFSGRAAYSLGVLLEGIGLPCLVVNSKSNVDLIYSATRPDDLPVNAVWLQSCGAFDWDVGGPAVCWHDGTPWLGRVNDSVAIKGDIVFSAFALLTGAFETPESKDQWGVPIMRGSHYESLGLLNFPAISKYCDLLLTTLCKAFGQDLVTMPRWPVNKRYAVVLSHDVDAPLSFIDTDYRKKWLRKLMVEGRYVEVGRGAYGYLRTVIQKSLRVLPRSENDPNFCFDAWINFQQKLKARSAFYVATTTSADVYGDVRDVNYMHNRADIVKALRGAVDRGWEVGLHGSMNAWRRESRITEEKAALERILPGYKLTGVRNHFWALDTEIPERTIAMHARAGFEYDSSLGLNDAPGYRRGIAWPFTPFDKSNNTALPIIEIPPTIMDGGVFYREVSLEQGKQEILDHVKRTFDSGGAVGMNWHLEQMNPVRLRQAGPALVEALCHLADDRQIYWASPAELCEWWKTRRSKLDACLS